MQYLGDFAEDANVYIPFNTFSSDDPQASVTITNLANADIHVHKDGSTTEIAADGATIAIDFDGITGNHLITIDTSADAAYSTGSDYIVRIEGTTVDAGTVNAFVGSFSIENRYQHGTAQTGDNFARIGVNGAGLTNINLPNQTMDITGNITGNVSGSVGSVTAAITLPTIPTNWIDSAGIAASAMNGKGDWNVGKTGYTLTQTFPTNFADLSITGATGQVELLTATQNTIDLTLVDIAALPTAAEVNAEMVDVMEVDTHTQPASVPAATTTYQNMLTYAFTLGRNKMTQTATTKLLRNDADSGTIGTSTVSDDGTTFTSGKFT